MVDMQDENPDLPKQDEGWWASILADEEPAHAEGNHNQRHTDRVQPQVDWETASRLFSQDDVLAVTAVGFNRGGLLVEGDRLAGFIPCSHLAAVSQRPLNEIERERCLAEYIGQELQVKIIECEPEENRLVFSERAARAGAGRRTQIFNALQVGQVIHGIVTNITDFGVFIDLGGVEGLIHISELSWGRVTHPAQILEIGQETDVQVLDISPERCRVALSLKRLLPNPWILAEKKYPVNGEFSAVITTLVPFGAFARLETGLEGLIHSSEIPLPPNGAIGDILTPGREVRVRIMHVDPSRQRMGLSMRLEL